MTQTTPTILSSPGQGKRPEVRVARELPILFSTDMVRAIFRGTKCTTRRTVGLDHFNLNPGNWHKPGIGLVKRFDGKEGFGAVLQRISHQGCDAAICPYGKPGDLLWVRETWAQLDTAVVYKADYQEPVDWKWKPSIHMRKVNTRIWLRNESVHLERLHDITIEDVVREGTATQGAGIKEFRDLWESINGAESWLINPWVWVVEFEVVSTIGKGGKPCRR